MSACKGKTQVQDTASDVTIAEQIAIGENQRAAPSTRIPNVPEALHVYISARRLELGADSMYPIQERRHTEGELVDLHVEVDSQWSVRGLTNH
eukprot:1373958-Prymnesium_polylepis.3